jgi:flagellar protein FliJ
MAKFRFRLASLLHLREAARDERQAALAEVFRLDEMLEERQGNVRREMDLAKQMARRGSSPGPIDVDQLVETQRYELTMKAQLGQLEQQRRMVAAEVERRRAALVEANREVRVLEKLRENQAQQFRAEEERLDIKRLDEVAQRSRPREEAI